VSAVPPRWWAHPRLRVPARPAHGGAALPALLLVLSAVAGRSTVANLAAAEEPAGVPTVVPATHPDPSAPTTVPATQAPAAPPSPGGDAANPTPGPTPAPAGTPTRLQPALATVNAGRGGSYSLSDKDPSILEGGVEVFYEKIHLVCDHLKYWQAPLVGAAHAQLSKALFATGPESADPEHVIFDSRATQLPMVGFRGLMTPVGVDVARLPADPATPKQVAYRMEFHDLEDFAGMLQTSAGWKPHAGWADEAEARLIADIVPAGLINQRFSSLVLHGRPAKDGEAKRRARLERLREPIPPSVKLSTLHGKVMDWWVESKTITILFDELGKAKQVIYDQDFHGEGTPSLDMPMDKGSQPALEPKPAPEPKH
jgi:hypothetical protein